LKKGIQSIRKKTMKQMWDKRYTGEDYFYGIQPNNFFKDKINDFKPGKILLPAEGEGRKSVYAAGLGWDVSAFDYSTEARGKALRLSKENNVQRSTEYTQTSSDFFKARRSHCSRGLFEKTKR
jgi:hypothetical protein